MFCDREQRRALSDPIAAKEDQSELSFFKSLCHSLRDQEKTATFIDHYSILCHKLPVEKVLEGVGEAVAEAVVDLDEEEVKDLGVAAGGHRDPRKGQLRTVAVQIGHL